MALLLLEKRLIFSSVSRYQQINFFKITNNSYTTRTINNININQTFFHTQKRHYGIKDFFEAFKEKLDENIKQTPEFGGDLKRLQDTSNAAASAAASSAKGTMGKVAEGVETVKKKTQEIIEPIAANPSVQEATKKVGEATEKAVEGLGEAYSVTARSGVRVFDPTRKIINKTKSKKVFDEIVRNNFAHLSLQFDPIVFDLDDQLSSTSNELVLHEDTRWTKFRSKMGQRWTELGEGDTRLSVMIETADNYGSMLKKMSNSKQGLIVEEIKCFQPYFTFEAFQKWVTHILFMKTLRGDPTIFPFHTERIKKVYKDKILPKRWSSIKVINIDTYEHPEAPFGFIFTLRGRATFNNFDKEKKVMDIRPGSFVISVAIKLSDSGVWQLADYHEIELTGAMF